MSRQADNRMPSENSDAGADAIGDSGLIWSRGAGLTNAVGVAEGDEGLVEFTVMMIERGPFQTRTTSGLTVAVANRPAAGTRQPAGGQEPCVW